jgi:hypothetical protein
MRRQNAAKPASRKCCNSAFFARHVAWNLASLEFPTAGGDGCYSQVFVKPIEALRGQFPIGLSTLLGYVATHELGHLLLGKNSHTAIGIMRAHWGPKELEGANMGVLSFFEDQRQQMASRLAAGIRRNEQVMAATASRCNVAAD